MYTCTHCHMDFDTPGELEEHTRTHTEEKPYKCKACGMEFAETGNFIQHMQAHINKKIYPCGFCERIFSQRCERTKHQKIHSGERPHVCPGCGRGFLKKSHLDGHRKSCDGEPCFRCPVCPAKWFKNGFGYKLHMDDCHPGYREQQLSISSQVSINEQTIPGVGAVCSVTHKLRSETTGVEISTSQVSDSSGGSSVYTEMRTTAPGTSTSTSTTTTTSLTSAQPYPVAMAAVASPEAAFAVPENPLNNEGENERQLDFSDLLALDALEDDFPW
ncbi:C2H2-type zinc finger protein [Candidatus Sororendozoicomonas aggregata]|uniref:C2H2-type zinc finger protein n=1 Tax=Candidatus Sororendozoicomonas aggregata TaxID=3073239 RepID=UPI002ED3C8A8